MSQENEEWKIEFQNSTGYLPSEEFKELVKYFKMGFECRQNKIYELLSERHALVVSLDEMVKKTENCKKHLAQVMYLSLQCTNKQIHYYCTEALNGKSSKEIFECGREIFKEEVK